MHGSGERAWAVLTSYVRATVVIAAVDALGIALVALILGLPLVVPLGVLVFLGAFIPVVGADDQRHRRGRRRPGVARARSRR